MSDAQQLLQLVERNLSQHLLEDAKFYAERLYYETGGSQEALNVLAQCYFRQNKIKQCYLLLQRCTLPANRYLLATCCYSLGKLDEAEATLVQQGAPPSMQTAASVPGGAAGLYLLGCVCRRGHRKEAAIQYLKLSLQVSQSLRPSVRPSVRPSSSPPALSFCLLSSLSLSLSLSLGPPLPACACACVCV